MTVFLYASLLSIIFVGLSINVIKGRRANGVAIGDGNNNELMRKIRAHGNFAEYTPIFLVLFTLAEMSGANLYILHALGFVFILGRISHAYSILYAENYDGERLTANPIWRISGMVCTFTGILGFSFQLLVSYFL